MRDYRHPNYMSVFEASWSDKPSLHHVIGAILAILATSKRSLFRTPIEIVSLVSASFQHNKFKIFYNEDELPVAYVIWANPGQRTEMRLLKNVQFDFHISEWNEFGHTWIVDLGARPGYFDSLIQYLRDNTFSQLNTVRYISVHNRHRRAIEISRTKFLGKLRTLPQLSKVCRCGISISECREKLK